MEAYIHIIALSIALVADWLLGDPRWIPHPIVAMGKSIAWFEKRYNKGHHRRLKGILTVFLLVALTYLFFTVGVYLTETVSVWVQLLFETFFCFTALAGTTLVRECRKVFDALSSSLQQGRVQVGYLVGRDTTELSAEEVKTATLETLAENLSDGVIAPLFWFAVGGLPFMLTYKMINTLDSMIAYKTNRYKEFGWFAAHLDDVVNWIPARITAFLMVLVAGSRRGLRFIFKYGHAHSSPNAGYPEAALAGILNVQFGGGHSYHGEWIDKPTIGELKRNISRRDLQKSIRINRGVELFAFAVVLLVHFALL